MTSTTSGRLASGWLDSGWQKDHRQEVEQMDTSKNLISPQLGSNGINDLALVGGAFGEVFRTLQIADSVTGSEEALGLTRPT